MEQIEIKQLSSLEKIFLNSVLEQPEYTEASALQGEVFSYQIAYRITETETPYLPFTVEVDSDLEEFLTVRCVKNVPSELPAYATMFGGTDEDYITTAPGLFPDLLTPCEEELEAVNHEWKALWITVHLPKNAKAGEHTIRVSLKFAQETLHLSFRLHVIGTCLPEQSLIYTQWFHGDCLYSYYQEKPFSERHWSILEGFIQAAADNGINMLLTPLFTPPLDTAEGKERPTIQLVEITKTGETYTFDFSKLRRWIAMCRKCGIRYFEMPHFFTQWGAKYTPKICVSENGNISKKFGWHVLATSAEYRQFLEQFVPALRDELKAQGVEEQTFYHISDEPMEKHKEQYNQAKQAVLDLLPKDRVIDCISDYSMYEQGVVNQPVVSLDHISRFLEHSVKGLWGYNCCAQTREVSNRFMAMPSWRNRIAGVQLYRYDIKGFLHWGYNFYYSAHSRKKIDPYQTTDALNAFPSGDAFSVYPGKDGKPEESIRLVVFHEALQDMRALQLLERFAGKEKVLQLIEKDGKPLTFTEYPREAGYLLHLREQVNREIEKYLP